MTNLTKLFANLYESGYIVQYKSASFAVTDITDKLITICCCISELNRFYESTLKDGGDK